MLAAIAYGLVTAACQPAIQEHNLLTGALPIEAPIAINAGDSVNVIVGPVAVTDGTLVGLVMVGKHGPRVYRSTFEQGIASFVIPGEHTLQPGYLALIAAADSARGEVGVILRPNPRQLRSGNAGLNVSSPQRAFTFPAPSTPKNVTTD